MRASLRRAILVVFTVATPALVDAHGTSIAGAPGDPDQAARSIEIVMSEDANGMHFSPDRVEVQTR